MARKTNYEEKINAVKEKITKKQAEVKSLKADLASLEEAYSKSKNRELIELMNEKGIDAGQAVDILKKAIG